MGNIDPNLQRNNVARQVEGFCISCFAALKLETAWTMSCGTVAYIKNGCKCRKKLNAMQRIAGKEWGSSVFRLRTKYLATVTLHFEHGLPFWAHISRFSLDKLDKMLAIHSPYQMETHKIY